MNNGVGIVIAGALVAGAILVVNLVGVEDPATLPDAVSTTPPPPAGAPPEPALKGAPAAEHMARLENELREARLEIHRLQKRMAAAGGQETAPTSPQALERKRDRFFLLSDAYSEGTATEKEVAEMLRMTGDKKLMERIVRGLKTHIAENLDDLEARMQLVEVQSARVHSAESITERAILRDDVQEQLGQVLKRDAENWDARYMRAVGISHSQRTPQGRATAIREFESLVALQQSRGAEPRFAKTYGQLATVYLAERNVAKARATLEAGLARYPDAKELKERLRALPADGN